MENEQKIVDFDLWCNRCKHRKLDGGQDPCNECLNNPVNINSHKPINFVPRFAYELVGGKMRPRERW